MLYVHAMLMLFQEMYRRSRSKFFRICALSFCKKDQGNIICPNQIYHLLVSKLYQQFFVRLPCAVSFSNLIFWILCRISFIKTDDSETYQSLCYKTTQPTCIWLTGVMNEMLPDDIIIYIIISWSSQIRHNIIQSKLPHIRHNPIKFVVRITLQFIRWCLSLLQTNTQVKLTNWHLSCGQQFTLLYIIFFRRLGTTFYIWYLK